MDAALIQVPTLTAIAQPSRPRELRKKLERPKKRRDSPRLTKPQTSCIMLELPEVETSSYKAMWESISKMKLRPGLILDLIPLHTRGVVLLTDPSIEGGCGDSLAEFFTERCPRSA
jgi:hypothetical protein